jgi:hypothetical protein
MSSTTLYRASGLALLLGLALIIIGVAISFAFQFLSPLWWVMTLVWNIGDLLLLLGLPGICARQAPRAGWLGFVGFLLTFISVFLTASFLWVSYLLIGPWLYQVAPKLLNSYYPQGLLISTLVAGILFALGGILLGIAIMRAGILPFWSGLLLLNGAVLSIVSFALNAIISNIVLTSTIVGTLAFVLLAVALGWIGFALMSTRSVEAAQPAPASS